MGRKRNEISFNDPEKGSTAAGLADTVHVDAMTHLALPWNWGVEIQYVKRPSAGSYPCGSGGV